MRLLQLSRFFMSAIALTVVLSNVVWVCLLSVQPLSGVQDDIIQHQLRSTIRNTSGESDQRHTTTFQSDAPLPPLRVFDQYKHYHSQESLLREGLDATNRRQFIVGYYSCPLQAGNRLHDFWNALLIGIMTNRTLLWKFMDTDICLATNPGYDPEVCTHNRTESDCASHSLKRAEWIPSFDEWAPKLGLNQTITPRNADHAIGGFVGPAWWPTGATKKRLEAEGRNRDMMTELEKHPSRPNWLKGRLIHTSREMIMDETVPRYGMRNKILFSLDEVTDQMIQMLDDLYVEGVDFLYGMLLRDTFTYLGEQELVGTSQDIAMSDRNAITIAVHSRHWTASDKGKLKGCEQDCLDDVVEATRRTRGYDVPCNMLIMSDRQLTVDAITNLATQR
jgi:hypothetical protein